MSKILVLSAHVGQIDRRITAEMNTLVNSGRDVTLTSIPTDIPDSFVDPRVKILMPLMTSARKIEWLFRLAKKLPPRLRDFATAAWHYVGKGPLPIWTNHFTDAAPAVRFDAIHCHDLWTLPAALQLRERYSPDAKIIYDSHELFPFQVRSCIVQQYLLNIERPTIRQADKVITVNDSIADELVKLYEISRPAVIWNSYEATQIPAPLNADAFAKHFGLGENSFRVMFQGVFIPGRNLDNLVRAFGLLDDSIHLCLLGRGERESALKKICRRNAITNVSFGDWVAQEDLIRYVRHADLGIIPYSGTDTLNNLYCTPNKLFEYIESLVPICASDLPELKKIIAGNNIGKVYDMESPEQIAAAIDNCKKSCEQGDFSDASRKVAREKFAWKEQGKKLLQIYEELGI